MSAKLTARTVMEKMENQPGITIGRLVMWTLLGCEIKVAALKALYAKHGLDWDEWGPKDIDGDKAFSKAIREAKRDAEGYRFVTLFQGEAKKVVGIVREDVDRAREDVKYKTDWTGDACKLTFDRINQAIKISNPTHPLGSKVKALYTDCTDTYMPNEFIRLLVRNIRHRLGGISLRSTGGSYFVPQQYMDVLLKHKSIIEDVSDRAEFIALAIKEEELSKKDLGRSAKRSIAEELQEIEAELEKWMADGLPRKDTLARRADEFKGLRAKAKMYQGMLSIKVDDLGNAITAAEKKLRELIGIKESESSKGGKKVKAVKAVEVEDEVQATDETDVEVQAKVMVKAAAPARARQKVAVVRK